MYKIGVIGDRESILGYSALGLDILEAGSPEAARGILSDSETVSKYAILYITETAASGCAKELERYRFERLPAIILIPDKSGSLGIGMAEIRKSVEKAVGADILF